VIRAQIKRLAAGARNVAKRQQHLRRGEMFAGAPIQTRAFAKALDKAFRECRLAGTGLGRNGNDPAATIARVRKGLA
jgi:hypothetical protein